MHDSVLAAQDPRQRPRGLTSPLLRTFQPTVGMPRAAHNASRNPPGRQA